MKLMDSDADEADWFSGASVSIGYTEFPPAILPDVDTFGGELTGCAATLYDLGGGETPPAIEDEGAVTIGGAGVASLMGPCTHLGGAYTCIAGTGAGATGDVVGFNAGAMLPTYTLSTHATGGDFTAGHIGTFLSVSGAEDADNDGAFPVLGFAAADTLLVGNTAPDLVNSSLDGATYAVVTGAGPTPARVPFLTDGQMVEVSKTAGNEVEAIATREITVGLGYRPDDTTVTMMRTFPIDSATPLAFTCTAGDGGNCGNAAGGTIISVTVTNADISAAGPFDLPPGANVVSVSCREFGNSASIPVEILDLIQTMSPAPTRARITVFRANFDLVTDADGTNQTGMVVGDGYTKFTDL
jgi:hypothetical protein